MTPEEFERKYGVTPDEAREEERAEFAAFSREEQLHIVRAIKMADSIANAASTLAAGIAALKHKDSSRLGAALTTMQAGDLGQAYISVLISLKKSIRRDGEATRNASFLKDLIWLTIRELEQDLIERYPPYRYLYQRLVGREIVPFLPSAFLAAVSLPRWDREWSRGAIASVEFEESGDFGTPPQFFPVELIV